MSKLEELKKLVLKRRRPEEGTPATGYSISYKKLANFTSRHAPDDPAPYDRDEHVAPFSQSSFNLDSDLMFIWQDWASEAYLLNKDVREQTERGYNPYLPSNKNFDLLLEEILGLTRAQTYSTDAFVFIKPNHMSGRIKRADLALSAKTYALAQIEIIRPKMVVCVGGETYRAIRSALGVRESFKVNSQCLTQKPLVYHGACIYGVTHIGGLGVSGLKGFDNIKAQWTFLRERHRELRRPS